MKKALALCLAAIMLLSLVGCGGSGSTATTAAIETTGAIVPSQTLNGDAQGDFGDYTFTFPGYEDDWVTEVDPNQTPVELEQFGYITNERTLAHKDMKYVMVYNPYIYDENLQTNKTLSTGRISDQIVVDMNRADGLTEEPEFIPVDQGQLNPFTIEGALESDRGSVMGRQFGLNDRESFYAFTSGTMTFPRQALNFTCIYSGQYCNVWAADNSVSTAQAKTCAAEFDNNIYNQVIETFGEPRFNGKINFLCYPMMEGLLGCFANADAFTAPEIVAIGGTQLGCNESVNMLHINSRYDLTSPDMISTLAHEFQHLICFSNSFETMNFNICRTWINEAMSAYTEEMLYPGIQYLSGRMDQLMGSRLLRYGQSMYNFSVDTSSIETWDIGVYGNVHLFSQYLARLGGENVFANFHKYWRTSYSNTLSEAEALANSVPKEVYDAVDQSVRYSPQILLKGFASKEEEWMSKLTLQYYLDMLDVDASDPADFRNLNPRNLVYDQLDSASIEGGGRVILEVKNGTYEIPMLSGNGLIYVALDADFNVLGISHG